MARDLTKNVEVLDKALPLFNSEYTRYKSQRDDSGLTERINVADAMVRCFKNSTIADLEKDEASGQPESERPASKVASTRFFRLVGQKNGAISQLANAAPLPFSYNAISNPEVFSSALEGSDQASVHNVLARYAWKNDNMPDRLYEMGFSLYVQSNVPVQMIWHEQKRRVKMMDRKTKKAVWKEVTTHAYPAMRTFSLDGFFADMYAGPIDRQRMVVIVQPTTWNEIENAVAKRWFSKEAYEEMIEEGRDKYKWDGGESSDEKKNVAANTGDAEPQLGQNDQVLQWDIYAWLPIKGAEWDDANKWELFWFTGLGNTLSKGVCKCVRFRDDFDPDGEIPIFMDNVLPDHQHLLYHMGYADVVRPSYSMECTLWGSTFDNNHGINHPFVAYDGNQLNNVPGGFQYKAGGKVDIRNPNESMREVSPRSTLSENAALIDRLGEVQESALNANANDMGRGFGGRMAATENLNITRMSSMPSIAEMRYVFGRLIRWYARKQKSYWQAYGPDALIKAIADESLRFPVYIDELTKTGKKDSGEKFPAGMPIFGDFDVEINVLDEWIKDLTETSQELSLMQTVGSVPIFAQSKTHRIDFGFWIRDFFNRHGVRNADRIVIPNGQGDAGRLQRIEIDKMWNEGVEVPINEGDDDAQHIAMIDAELLRLSPLTSVDPQELTEGEQKTRGAVDIFVNTLLKPHREAHAARLAQADRAMSPGATPAAPAGSTTPGQAAGGVPAAALGAALGG